MDPAEGARRLQETMAWSPGQAILNSTGARQPEHTFRQPVPIAARIVWANDGEEHIDRSARLDRAGRVRAAARPALPVHCRVLDAGKRVPPLVRRVLSSSRSTSTGHPTTFRFASDRAACVGTANVQVRRREQRPVGAACERTGRRARGDRPTKPHLPWVRAGPSRLGAGVSQE
jgi:hypothetical protein